jgi:hypothetical protein
MSSEAPPKSVIDNADGPLVLEDDHSGTDFIETEDFRIQIEHSSM